MPKGKSAKGKTKTPKAMDAIAMLKADHKKVAGLFEDYEKGRAKKVDIAKTICLELLVHTTIEEEILYPACKGVVEEDMLDEAYVEHDGAKMMIAELEEGTPVEPFYDAKVKVLSEEIKHHVKEEEQPGGLFAQLRQSDVDLVALGAALKARKDELMATMKGAKLPMPMTRTMKGADVRYGTVAERAP